MDDPFAEIAQALMCSSSQEERLRHSRFYLQPESGPQVPPIFESTDGEGIPVVSLPETSSRLKPLETLLMNSQKQTMSLAGGGDFDRNVSSVPVGDDDLGKGCDRGVSLEKSPADKGLLFVQEVLRLSGESSSLSQEIASKISEGLSKCKNGSKDVDKRGLMQIADKRGSPSSENQSLVSLLDSIISFSRERNASTDPGNVDILEIVKKRGMTFKRPRWWPPEGFERETRKKV